MPNKGPLSFPSRDSFSYNSAVPDRQLWAIGMMVAQWSMTEIIIEQQIRQLINGDHDLTAQFDRRRNFQQIIEFWQTQIRLKTAEPLRTEILALIARINNLRSQRDEVIHRAWGGGMQAGSWSAEDHPSTDAALLRKAGDKQKPKGSEARNLVSWNLTFNRLRQMTRDIDTLNRDLFHTFFLPRGQA